jgi:hypothetical protein
MTNKHPHADMIKAKADNMDLVVFKKNYEEIWVELSDQSEIRIKRNLEYFACLPQHKEACLHWLNGGDIQWSDHIFGWTDKDKFEDDLESQKFFYGNGFMRSEINFRIKPRKEKRWIVVRKSDLFVGAILYGSEEAAKRNVSPSYWSFHEIEIEV